MRALKQALDSCSTRIFDRRDASACRGVQIRRRARSGRRMSQSSAGALPEATRPAPGVRVQGKRRGQMFEALLVAA